MYELPVKKTMLISIEQNKKLKHFCKLNRVSASQLFRIFIDELMFSDPMPLKYALQEATFKTENFISVKKPAAVVKESINDGNGNLRTRWFQSPWASRNKIQREEMRSYPARGNM